MIYVLRKAAYELEGAVRLANREGRWRLPEEFAECSFYLIYKIPGSLVG